MSVRLTATQPYTFLQPFTHPQVDTDVSMSISKHGLFAGGITRVSARGVCVQQGGYKVGWV